MPKRAIYEGSLAVGKMSKEVHAALQSFCGQKMRNTVEYTSREFVAWWLEELKTFAGSSRPTCGRIDHSRGYSWDNIQMQSQSENTREMALRTGAFKKQLHRNKKINVYIKGTSTITGSFRSVRAAAQFFGVSESHIANTCNRSYKGNSLAFDLGRAV